MTIRNLSCMMQPASVVLITDSLKPCSLGAVVARNLSSAGFQGKILSVNPQCEAMEGILNYADVESLPMPADLAVITTAPDSIPGLIDRLGARGTKVVVLITPGFFEGDIEYGRRLRTAILKAAKPHLLRIAGPDSLGVMVPGACLNASLGHIQPIKGNLAFITQSGSVLTAVLDWATSRNVGFSHLISLGAMIDVDLGDMLDYLANDADSRAILLYVESITHARKFMSAARLAARLKPVIVLKGGRHTEGRCASRVHTGSMAGADAVYHAAFRRAGMLRVYSIEELFDAVETLGIARTSLPTGERLAILTNGGGIGVLATDALINEGGCLADLSADSMAKLNMVLPLSWSHANPVDIMGDASGVRYADALEVLLSDKGVDAVLALHCPNALAAGTETARAVVDAVKKRSCGAKSHRVLTSWLGDGSACAARRLFAENKIPTYETPNDAVRGFMQLVRYRRNQEILLQTPPAICDALTADPGSVRRIAGRAIAEDRTWLAEAEVREVLGAYGIDAGSTGDASHELFIGMAEDEQFGPVIRFGHGGKAFEIIQDEALALPPLNMHLARDVMSRTRIGRLLEGCGMPSACIEAIALTLIKVSQLVCDIDEIRELEINPLLAGEKGVAPLSARMRVARPSVSGAERLCIRPYPKELEQTISLPDGHTVLLRPVLPEDEPAYHRLFASLSPEEVFMRFMSHLKALPQNLAVRLTQLDYDREMALVLVGRNEAGETELYGGVRIIADSDNEQAEFAILLRRDMTGMGFGPMLMRRIIDYARSRGIGEIFGEVLSENRAMLRLCQVFGFSVKCMPDDPGVRNVSLRLITGC